MVHHVGKDDAEFYNQCFLRHYDNFYNEKNNGLRAHNTKTHKNILRDKRTDKTLEPDLIFYSEYYYSLIPIIAWLYFSQIVHFVVTSRAVSIDLHFTGTFDSG